MRCDDLTRELARPTGALTEAEVAGHLAGCPACSERSRDAARFDQIWEATRPVEPSGVALDALWAQASAALDARPAVGIIPFAARPGSRRRWVVAALVLAQAAAVLVAASAWLRRDADQPVELAVVVPNPVEANPLDLNVEPDVVTTVRIDTSNHYRVETENVSYLFESPTLPVETPKDLSDAVETMAPLDVVASVGK